MTGVVGVVGPEPGPYLLSKYRYLLLQYGGTGTSTLRGSGELGTAPLTSTRLPWPRPRHAWWALSLAPALPSLFVCFVLVVVWLVVVLLVSLCACVGGGCGSMPAHASWRAAGIPW